MKAKIWFEGLGRRARAMGISHLKTRANRRKWPIWAQRAWARGYILQGGIAK